MKDPHSVTFCPRDEVKPDSDRNMENWKNWSTGCITSGDETIAEYYGVKRNNCKTFIFYLFVILSGGLLFLVAHWKPKWRSKLTQSRCTLDKATALVIEDQYKQVEIVTVLQRSSKDNMQLHDNLARDEDDSDRFSNSYIDSDEERALLTRKEEKEAVNPIRFFEYHHHRYFWNNGKFCFQIVTSVNSEVSFRDVYKNSQGLTRGQENEKLVFYSENKIDVNVKPYVTLFFEEAADPFYIFQLFSCIMWFFDDYYYYSGTIILISLISIFTSIYQTRQHLTSLRNMIAKSENVTVIRPSGEEEVISSEFLVPGDVFLIPPNGCELHCDAALLSGTAITNESMLTGESVPVMKTPLPNPPVGKSKLNEVIDTTKHKRHTLFCGTKVLQTRFYEKGKVLAYVLKTGYYTTKGELIRSILFPKPVGYRFFSDAMKFVGVLGIFASVGFVYTCYVFEKQGASTGEITLRALDVITIAVPPALPAAMTVGTIYALQRLKRVQIFCTSPSRINISGKTKLFCFDKTGTLTEDGLDYFGVILAESGKFQDCMADLSNSYQSKGLQCMASCHSLTVIDGEITGDPLDIKMFEATGWELEESPGLEETERFESLIPTIVRPKNSKSNEGLPYQVKKEDKHEIALLKQFTFSSELQRSSVIVRKLAKQSMDVFVKGSPEMIASLCLAETLPKDFQAVLKKYAKEGFRVIALASKSLAKNFKWHHLQHVVRTDVEKDLHFNGFLVLKNMVKPETKPTVESLYQSNIRVVMITGDNLLTAVSVAKECHMVSSSEAVVHVSASYFTGSDKPNITYTHLGNSKFYNACNFGKTFQESIFDFRTRGYHFVLNGKTFACIRAEMPVLYQRLLVCATIFARMLPDQKAQLVEDLQSIGYTVGMCGDGANDCGALKVAHAGVSLSEAEASIASPFTSRIPNISCVLEIVKEGRCALVTSFSLFKYMALYSMVQYTTVLLLYSVRSNLGDLQYLYIDLFIIMPFAVTMSRTGAYHKIVSRRPLGSLVHPLILASLILQIFTQLAFQLVLFFFVKTRGYYKSTDWFHEYTHNTKGATQVLSYDNTVLFYLSSFQYIFLAVVFSIGKPYRGKLYKNGSFVCVFFVLTGFTILLTVYPIGFLEKIFELVPISDTNFTIGLLLWAGCNAVISFAIETFIVKSETVRHFLNFLRRKKRKKNKYKHIIIDMALDETWPPVAG